MNQHEEVFLSVLRSALWGHPVQVPDGFNDWGAVMKLANMQAVNGLVWDVMVTNQKIKASIPEQAVAAMRDIPKNNLSMHTKLNNALILVVTTLREHGIEPVLLKGQGLAKYYPVPELRQCGDIDLYVGLDNYEKAYVVLRLIASELEDITVTGKHFYAKVGTVLIEVHRFANVLKAPKLNDFFQSYANDGLTKKLVPIKFGDIEILTPADDFNIYYIFNHIWTHIITSGVGLRQFCDLAVFLNTHDVNCTYLKRILTEMNDIDTWQVFGCLIVDFLGLSRDKFPFYNPKKRNKGRLLFEMIISEGNFGRYSFLHRERKYGYVKEKLLSLKWILYRQCYLLVIFHKSGYVNFMGTFKAGISQVLKDLTSKLRR